MTQWKPDTCGCIIEFKGNMEFVKAVKKCDLHNKLDNQNLLDEVMKLNREKKINKKKNKSK